MVCEYVTRHLFRYITYTVLLLFITFCVFIIIFIVLPLFDSCSRDIWEMWGKQRGEWNIKPGTELNSEYSNHYTLVRDC